MEHDEITTGCAFARKIDALMDLAKVDMRQMQPQTAEKNSAILSK